MGYALWLSAYDRRWAGKQQDEPEDKLSCDAGLRKPQSAHCGVQGTHQSDSR